MKSTTRARMIDMLKGAASLLFLVPDAPGIADNAAVGGLRLIITAITKALEGGASTAEIVRMLSEMEPAAKLDVDAELDEFLK